MASTSRMPAFRTALVDALTDALPGVQVRHWWPGAETAPKGVYLGDVSGVIDFANLTTGRAHRNEEFSQQVVCQDWQTAQSPQDVSAGISSVLDLYGGLDSLLADDPTLGGVVQWSRLSAYQTEPFAFDKGVAVVLTATVTAFARLT